MASSSTMSLNSSSAQQSTRKPVRTSRLPNHMNEYIVNGSDPKPDQIVNHDWCDSCGDGGDLLCCDECPASFHLCCLDPPLTKVPDGDWSCNSCRSKRKPHHSSAINIVAPIVKKIINGNPTTFKLPESISSAFEVGFGYEKDEFGFNTNGKLQFKKRKSHDSFCKICKQEEGEMAQCSRCIRSYHLYCLDPPLLTMPQKNWQCPAHQIRASDSSIPSLSSYSTNGQKPASQVGLSKSVNDLMNGNYILPEEILHLDFGTFSVIPNTSNSTKLNRRVQREPQRSIQKISSSADAVLTEVSRPSNKEELVSKALPTSNAVSLAETSVDQLKSLPPLFVQFLAWQRLIQIHQETNNPSLVMKSFEQFMASSPYSQTVNGLGAPSGSSSSRLSAHDSTNHSLSTSSRRSFSEAEKYKDYDRERKRRHEERRRDTYDERRDRDDHRHHNHHSSRSARSSKEHRSSRHDSSYTNSKKRKHEDDSRYVSDPALQQHSIEKLDKKLSEQRPRKEHEIVKRPGRPKGSRTKPPIPPFHITNTTSVALPEAGTPIVLPVSTLPKETNNEMDVSETTSSVSSESSAPILPPVSPVPPEVPEVVEVAEVTEIAEAEESSQQPILEVNTTMEEDQSFSDLSGGFNMENGNDHQENEVGTESSQSPKADSTPESSQANIFGSLTLVDPNLHWQDGSSVFNITKKSIVIGRTRINGTSLDVNMEGVTENAKFVSHRHLQLTFEDDRGHFMAEILGRNPVTVDNCDYRRGPLIDLPSECTIILGKTQLRLKTY